MKRKSDPTDLFSASTLSQQPGISQQQSVTMKPRVKQQSKEALITQKKSKTIVNTGKKSTTEDMTSVITEALQENKLPARLVEE